MLTAEEIRKREEATRVLKFDEEEQIVMGVVYAPDMPDSHGDFMTAEEVKKACYAFMTRGDMTCVDIMHDNKRYGCEIVECFIVRDGDPDFPLPGAWVAAVHCPNEIWARVKDGELNGFSMEAIAYKEAVEREIDFPENVKGLTTKEDDHTHEFEVMFAPDGTFVGGRTSIVKDSKGRSHYHAITKGVKTDETNDHAHRFAFLESMPRLSSDENSA
jgi:hypothetical protein